MQRLTGGFENAFCKHGTQLRSQRLAKRQTVAAYREVQPHGTVIRVSPVAKSLLIPGTAGLMCALAGNAVANQTGLGEPVALAVGLVLSVAIVSLDAVSSIREDTRLERERPIFLTHCERSIMMTTAAISDACADDLSKLESCMKTYLKIDSDTPLNFTVTTREGFSTTIDMELQMKSRETVSDFLRNLTNVTVASQK